MGRASLFHAAILASLVLQDRRGAMLQSVPAIGAAEGLPGVLNPRSLAARVHDLDCSGPSASNWRARQNPARTPSGRQRQSAATPIAEPPTFRLQSRLQRSLPKRIVPAISARSRDAASVRSALDLCSGSIQIEDVRRLTDACAGGSVGLLSSPAALLETGIWAVLGIFVRRKSRTSVLVAAAYMTLNIELSILRAPLFGVITLILCACILSSVRGTFAYRSLSVASTTPLNQDVNGGAAV